MGSILMYHLKSAEYELTSPFFQHGTVYSIFAYYMRIVQSNLRNQVVIKDPSGSPLYHIAKISGVFKGRPKLDTRDVVHLVFAGIPDGLLQCNFLYRAFRHVETLYQT